MKSPKNGRIAIAFKLAKYTGDLSSSENTRELLQEIEETEAMIVEITNKIKKETNLRDKVNMNIELKNLNDKLNDLKGSL